MILGRPTQLWTAAITGLLNALVLLGVVHLDVLQVAGLNVAAGGFIALLAVQAPTLRPGDTFKVQTPEGQPNYETTVAHPPAADPPPVPVDKP